MEEEEEKKKGKRKKKKKEKSIVQAVEMAVGKGACCPT